MQSRLLAVAGAFALAAADPLPGERDLTGYTFQQYVAEFYKSYGADEHAARRGAFEANLARIRQQNADGSKSWFATVNQFTDWTLEEFVAQRLGRSSRHEAFPLAGLQAIRLEDLDSSVDWRTKAGVVTPVKDQGGCGSCWAFSATETLESMLAIATGQAAPILSPQQIVSCAPNPDDCGGTGGCAGSTQPLAFNYTKTAGITLESLMPYSGQTGTCPPASSIKPVAINDGFVSLAVNDYQALMAAVATKGPIAISVAAGSFGWQLYGGGVFSSGIMQCSWDQDHAVQLVGYGTDAGKDYWLVRNSWGSGWGEEGYIRIQRFGDGKEPCGMDTTPQDGDACKGDTTPRKYCGLCGILSGSSYPTGLTKVGVAALVV